MSHWVLGSWVTGCWGSVNKKKLYINKMYYKIGVIYGVYCKMNC